MHSPDRRKAAEHVQLHAEARAASERRAERQASIIIPTIPWRDLLALIQEVGTIRTGFDRNGD